MANKLIFWHLRNELVHNNDKVFNHKKKINSIAKQNKDVNLSEDCITLSGPDFILDCLQKETLVLKELCKKLGLQHERINWNEVLAILYINLSGKEGRGYL